MSWNYRVMKHKLNESESFYGIHEVYYNRNGKPDGWSKDSITPERESPQELKEDLEMMIKAFDKPVLNYDSKKIAKEVKGE